MYNLIIIDDEEIIRNGFSKFVDWNRLNIKVVELFEDGKEAIEYLKKNDVDIVLTDIKMVDKTGLDVAEFIHVNKPYIKTVFMSGYKEFEYAKKAIEYKVENYILKPTNFQKVNEIFKEIVKKLDEERTIQKQIPLLETQFINDLLFGAIHKKAEIEKRAVPLGFSDKIYDACAYFEFEIKDNQLFLENNWSYGKERLNMAISNFFKSLNKEMVYYPLFNESEDFTVFAYSKNKNVLQFEHLIEGELKEICESIKGFIDLNIELLNFKCFNNFFELATYSEKLNVIENVKEDANILNINMRDYKKILQKYKLFFSKINEGKLDEIESLNESFFNQLADQPIQFTQKVVIDLLANLSNKFSQLDVDIISITNGKINYNHILKIRDMDELQNYCFEIYTYIASFIGKNKDESAERVIEKAMSYIDENYQYDISLEDVSNHVFLNSVYFCRYFKQKTGETFTDYLTKVRMNEAIRLIKAGQYKTYEISEKVGYKSSKYFSRVFKQYTGLSPTEYGKI